MGVLSALRVRREQRDIAEGVSAGIQAGIYVGGPAAPPESFPYASPWSTRKLERWAYQDMFGTLPQNTRKSAMAIPAVARGRTLLAVQGAKQPLVELEGDTRVAEQPYWMTHCGDGSSPFHRMLWTIDDLIWYPASLWWRDNPGTAQETRSHVSYDDWEIDRDRRRILINGGEPEPENIILIPGSGEGVLSAHCEAIVDARNLYQIVSQRVKNPVPQIELHDTEGNLNPTERDELLASWRAARQTADTQGVAYTSKRIQVIERGQGNDSQLLIEARNAAAVDAARMIGVHAGMVDATTPKASLNYETQSGRNEEFGDFDLDAYLEPIAARLSMDDVCAPGRRVTFDRGQFTTLTPSPTGPSLED